MPSFLIVAGTAPDAPPDLFSRAGETTRCLLPASVRPATLSAQPVPEISGGWFILRKEDRSQPDLIDSYSDERVLVFCHGKVEQEDGAARVARAWLEGGAASVRGVPGSFSAVVIDRHAGVVEILSHTLGACAFRYVVSGAFLAVSPHDLPLVACGAIEPDFDTTSAASVIAFDWSLGGRSLLRGVETCRPGTTLRWEGGELTEREDDRILPGDRMLVPPHRAASALDEVIDWLRADVADTVSGEPEVDIALTAGLDSRAVLALLLSCTQVSRLRGITQVTEDSTDVEMAGWICRKFGIPHRVQAMHGSASEFRAGVEHGAFFMNGDTCAKGSTHDRETHRVLTFGGHAGEIHRGYYYPSRDPGELAGLTPPDVSSILLRFVRLARVHWIDDQLPRSVTARLETVLREIRKSSEHPLDMLDLFYVLERSGVWGATHDRDPDLDRVVTPYRSLRLIRHSFSMPYEVRIGMAMPYRILERLLPESLGWLLNGRYLLPRPGERQPARTFRRVRQVVKRTLRGGSRGGSSDLGFPGAFGTWLRSMVHDTLLSDASLAAELLTRPALEAMVANPRSHDDVEIIGCLLSMDTWRSQIREAAAEARANRV